MKKELLINSLSIATIRGLGALLLFLTTLVYAKLLGAYNFGIFSLLFTFVTIVSVFSKVGLDNVVLKQVGGNYRSNNAISKEYIYSSIFLIFIVALLATAVMYIFSDILLQIFQYTIESKFLEYFSFGVILISLVAILSQIFKAIGMPKISSFFQVVLPPLTTLILVFILWLRDLVSLENFIIVFLLGFLLSLITSFLYLLKKVPPKLIFLKHKYANLLKEGWPMLLITSGGLIMSWADTIIVGIFLEPTSVGLYSVCSRIVLISSLILISINSITAPKYAKLYKENRLDEMKILSHRSFKILFVFVLIPTIFFIFGPKYILSFFGHEFEEAYLVLIILAIGQFVNVSCGSVGYLLSMTNKEKVFQNIILTAASINILLSVILVHFWGIEGVAISTMVSVIIWNILAIIKVKEHLGFWTFGHLGKTKGNN